MITSKTDGAYFVAHLVVLPGLYMSYRLTHVVLTD